MQTDDLGEKPAARRPDERAQEESAIWLWVSEGNPNCDHENPAPPDRGMTSAGDSVFKLV